MTTFCLTVLFLSIYSSNSQSFDCSENKECKGVSRTCEPNQSCSLTCGGEQSCSGAELDGSSANDVKVKCDSWQACKSLEVQCGAGACGVECLDDQSCMQLELTCGDATCTLHCDVEDSCKQVEVKQLSNTQFSCTGDYCPSDLVDTPTPRPTSSDTSTEIPTITSTEIATSTETTDAPTNDLPLSSSSSLTTSTSTTTSTTSSSTATSTTSSSTTSTTSSTTSSSRISSNDDDSMSAINNLGSNHTVAIAIVVVSVMVVLICAVTFIIYQVVHKSLCSVAHSKDIANVASEPAEPPTPTPLAMIDFTTPDGCIPGATTNTTNTNMQTSNVAMTSDAAFQPSNNSHNNRNFNHEGHRSYDMTEFHITDVPPIRLPGRNQDHSIVISCNEAHRDINTSTTVPAACPIEPTQTTKSRANTLERIFSEVADPDDDYSTSVFRHIDASDAIEAIDNNNNGDSSPVTPLMRAQLVNTSQSHDDAKTAKQSDAHRLSSSVGYTGFPSIRASRIVPLAEGHSMLTARAAGCRLVSSDSIRVEKKRQKLLFYDFDQTITCTHLYHELEEASGMHYMAALKQMSSRRLIEVFGGWHRIERLRMHFERLQRAGCKCVVVSFGYAQVIAHVLEKMDVSHYFAAIVGRESMLMLQAKGDKTQLIRSWMHDEGSVVEDVWFIDDDPRHVAKAKKDNVCQTLWVETRQGMNESHFMFVEKQVLV